MTTLGRNVELIERRCLNCGRYFLFENVRGARCPLCASEEIRKANERTDRAERSARALRAYVARMKAAKVAP